MKYNLGCDRDILFREHENTGVSNIMPFLFFYCGCVGELFNIRFRSTTSSEGESTSHPFTRRKIDP